VAATADAGAVRRAAHEARDEAVLRFSLRTMPTEAASLPRAEALYAQSCAVCHGARGDADTERARALDPQPASFRDETRLAQLSPTGSTTRSTFGVSGTAMAPSTPRLRSAGAWPSTSFAWGTPARRPGAPWP
jgi:high-affinity iron transporter